MSDEYDTHLPMSLISHRRRVIDALREEHASARPLIEQTGIHRRWWDYKGDEVPPFVAYTRWQPGRLTLAALYGKTTKGGRMPVLCEAMEDIAYEHHLSLRYEAISNPHLVRYLRRRDCVIAPGTVLMPDMSWQPDDTRTRHTGSAIVD
jgi:hypothetical protein